MTRSERAGTRSASAVFSGTAALLLGAALAVPHGAAAQPAAGLRESPAPIEYPSPAAAFNALRVKPGVTMTLEKGWVVAADPAGKAVWSFAPPTSPAAPAVVKRVVMQQGSDVMIQTGVLCGGPKAACDQLVLQFQQLNRKVREEVGRGPGQAAPRQP